MQQSECTELYYSTIDYKLTYLLTYLPYVMWH